MRRGWALAGLGAVAVLRVAGCGEPGGGDGDPIHPWPPLVKGKAPVPAGGARGGRGGPPPPGVPWLIAAADGKKSVTKTEDTPGNNPHKGESAGLHTARDGAGPAERASRRKLANNGCEEVVAHFLGYS